MANDFLNSAPPLITSEAINLRKNLYVRGIAVVSSDGFIAGSEGGTSWASIEDKNYFESVLPEPALFLMGRETFDKSKSKNFKRKRLIFTNSDRASDSSNYYTSFSAINTHQDITTLLKLLNNLSAEFKGNILVLGGSQIYSLILQTIGFDAFDLTIEDNVSLQNGLTLFSGINFALSGSKISGKAATSSNLSSKTRLLLYR